LKQTPNIVIVVGARPNFMKIAPIVRNAASRKIKANFRIFHTGQHYDENMNDVFFRQLNIPEPDVFLEGTFGSHARQTHSIMVGFEDYCLRNLPDMTIVVGDVNSTLACALVSKKLKIDVAHVEAGLRSGDKAMPEEINRIATDAISDLFFASEPSAVDNLQKEGHSKEVIHHVGNVMIDSLFYHLDEIALRPTANSPMEALKRSLKDYCVVTLHRPSNVDVSDRLKLICDTLNEVAKIYPIIFPVHPRTQKLLEESGKKFSPNIHLLQPLPYLDFLNLWKDASAVITDSGGLQEETTAIGVPCFTLRENTERPITIFEGTNTLVGDNMEKLKNELSDLRNAKKKNNSSSCPMLWDGQASNRILDIVTEHLNV